MTHGLTKEGEEALRDILKVLTPEGLIEHHRQGIEVALLMLERLCMTEENNKEFYNSAIMIREQADELVKLARKYLGKN